MAEQPDDVTRADWDAMLAGIMDRMWQDEIAGMTAAPVPWPSSGVSPATVTITGFATAADLADLAAGYGLADAPHVVSAPGAEG